MAEVRMDKIPPTSKTEKEHSSKKLIKGEAKIKHKHQFLSALIEDDIPTIIESVVYDTLVPETKNFIRTILHSAVDYIFNGSGNSQTYSRGNYQRDYSSYSRSPSQDRPWTARNVRRNRYYFEEVEFDSRSDAEIVLDELADNIETYGSATVADFFTTAGYGTEPSDSKYGWTSLSRASINTRRGKWIINMPRPLLLD